MLRGVRAGRLRPDAGRRRRELHAPHAPRADPARRPRLPLYDGGNLGIRRRQLHDILRLPGYDQMLAAEGRTLTG